MTLVSGLSQAVRDVATDGAEAFVATDDALYVTQGAQARLVCARPAGAGVLTAVVVAGDLVYALAFQDLANGQLLEAPVTQRGGDCAVRAQVASDLYADLVAVGGSLVFGGPSALVRYDLGTNAVTPLLPSAGGAFWPALASDGAAAFAIDVAPSGAQLVHFTATDPTRAADADVPSLDVPSLDEASFAVADGVLWRAARDADQRRVVTDGEREWSLPLGDRVAICGGGPGALVVVAYDAEAGRVDHFLQATGGAFAALASQSTPRLTPYAGPCAVGDRAVWFPAVAGGLVRVERP